MATGLSELIRRAKQINKQCCKDVINPLGENTSKTQFLTMRIHVGILPDDIQREVIKDDHRYKVCVWGRQRGKTITALLWLAERAQAHPNTVHWYVAPTYKQAKHIAWDKARALIPRDLLAKKPNEQSLHFTFKNGSKLYLIGADNPDTLRGPSLTSVVLDEYGTMKSTAWTQAIEPMLAATRGHVLFIGTPNAFKGPHLEKLWREVQAGEIPDAAWWHQKTSQGAHITAQVIEEARRGRRAWEFEQEYEAEFKDVSGRIWYEFVDKFIDDTEHPGHKLHVDGNKPFADCPSGWDVYCGIDFGHTHPLAAIWIAQGPSGQIQVLAEYVAPRKRFAEHAHEIKRISKLYGGVHNIVFVGDPSAPQMGLEFRNEGIDVKPAINAVYAGIERVGRLMNHGYLTISACCTSLIRGIVHYMWDPNSKRPRPLKIEDDECDAFRYAVMATTPPEAFSASPGEKDILVDSWEEDPIFTEQLMEDNWDETGNGMRGTYEWG